MSKTHISLIDSSEDNIYKEHPNAPHPRRDPDYPFRF
jgi:hypothetical protein